MKITQTRLKQIIQEELAAVQETLGSEPPPPSASPDEVKKVVAELFNVAAKVQALGQDFFADYDSLDLWIGEFMEKHKVLQQGELEEGRGGPSHEASTVNKPRSQADCGPDKTYKPPSQSDYRDYGTCVEKDKASERNKRLNRYGYEE